MTNNAEELIPEKQEKPTSLAKPSDIGRAYEPRYVDAAAAEEAKAIETRAQRISSDIQQQRLDLQHIIFNAIFMVIISLYIVFFLCILSLALSERPFSANFPVTGLVFLGILGSVPTILSAFLMTGLFSHKESGKEEKSSATDISVIAKIATEAVKFLRH